MYKGVNKQNLIKAYYYSLVQSSIKMMYLIQKKWTLKLMNIINTNCT